MKASRTRLPAIPCRQELSRSWRRRRARGQQRSKRRSAWPERPPRKRFEIQMRRPLVHLVSVDGFQMVVGTGEPGDRQFCLGRYRLQRIVKRVGLTSLEFKAVAIDLDG